MNNTSEYCWCFENIFDQIWICYLIILTCVATKKLCLFLFNTDLIHLVGGFGVSCLHGCTWNCLKTFNGPYNKVPKKRGHNSVKKFRIHFEAWVHISLFFFWIIDLYEWCLKIPATAMKDLWAVDFSFTLHEVAIPLGIHVPSCTCIQSPSKWQCFSYIYSVTRSNDHLY